MANLLESQIVHAGPFVENPSWLDVIAFRETWGNPIDPLKCRMNELTRVAFVVQLLKDRHVVTYTLYNDSPEYRNYRGWFEDDCRTVHHATHEELMATLDLYRLQGERQIGRPLP
jgi:hypothetical protein